MNEQSHRVTQIDLRRADSWTAENMAEIAAMLRYRPDDEVFQTAFTVFVDSVISQCLASGRTESNFFVSLLENYYANARLKKLPPR